MSEVAMTGLAGGLMMGFLLFSLIGLTAFLVLKAMCSFAVLRAFNSAGPESAPLSANRCAGLAMVRALLDVPMLVIVMLAIKQAKWVDTPAFWPVVFIVLCVMRATAWWALGMLGTEFRMRTLRVLIALGVGVDVMLDGILLLVYFAATRPP